MGISPSTVEVRFENLHIEAKVFVGARALPTVLNSYRNFFEVRHCWHNIVVPSLLHAVYLLVARAFANVRRVHISLRNLSSGFMP